MCFFLCCRLASSDSSLRGSSLRGLPFSRRGLLSAWTSFLGCLSLRGCRLSVLRLRAFRRGLSPCAFLPWSSSSLASSLCDGLFVVVFCGFVLLPCWPSVACCFCVGFCCFVWASGASCELPLLGVGFYCLVWCGLLLHRVGFFCFVFWFLLLCMGLLVFLNATNIESRARVPFEGHQKAHGKGPVDKHQPK